MLEEFKYSYSNRRWLRYTSWIGLSTIALFLLWASGGFPPQAWLLLLQFICEFPQMWSEQGAAILLPLVGLLLLSLVWLMVWWALAWVCLRLLQHDMQQQLNRRQQDLMWWVTSYAYPYSAPLTLAQSESYALMDINLDTTMPRLRLPQRPQRASPPALTTPPVPDTGGFRTLREMSEHTTSTAIPITALTGPHPLPPLGVGVGWHVGIKRRRSPNEDSVVAVQSTCTYQAQLIPFGLFVVADGMGGHAGGQEASRIAIQSMMHTVLQNIIMSNELSDEFLTDMLIGGVEWANQAIYQRGQERGVEMGTTLTAALIFGAKAYVVNVGDSRTYLYRNGVGLTQITRDHSLVATLVSFGEITADEIYTHPERNKVYRSLGMKEHVDIDWFVVDLCSRDRLLLCSDGLWEMVRDPEISRILANAGDATRASDALVQAALQGGGADNVSVVVVQIP
ncbi:MAG TPA: PP2C family serine/threonine-protein phosphatase [Ktedonobacteraceae bacterium]|nr:PP2C family serine/threonine-protein phosphatase [Ktedonobacteraceae bacterium]